MNSGNARLIMPKQHILPCNNSGARKFVEQNLAYAVENSRAQIDHAFWRALLDPKGQPCLDKPSGQDLAQLQAAFRAFYDNGNNISTIMKANYNPFAIPSEKVIVSCLTDSGTGKNLPQQDDFVASLCAGENPLIPNAQNYAYARAVSRELLDVVVAEVFGKQFFFHPVLQGRAGEFLLLLSLAKAGLLIPGDVVLANKPFDTTKGHIQNVSGFRGPIARILGDSSKCGVISCTPLTTPGLYESAETPFLGNMPLDRLEQEFRGNKGKAKIVLMTATDNGGGGQPVSMENVRKVAEFARKNGLILWIDACRIFHNAEYIKLHEKGYENRGLDEIAKEMLSYADVATISFKKMNAHSGGAVLLNSESPLLKGKLEGMRNAIKQTTTVMYGNGFDSYCGLTGYEMVEIMSGIFAMMDPEVVGSVVAQINSAYKVARHYGVPAVGGGHAIYIAADQMMNVRSENCPAEYLQAINYAAMGFQGCGLGNIVYGKWKKTKDGYGLSYKPEMDSLRYAFPRFNYPDATLDLMFKIMGIAHQEGLFGKLVGGLTPANYEANGFYHFGGKYQPVDVGEFIDATVRLREIAAKELGL